MTEKKLYPSTELPEHPQAAIIAEQMKLLGILIDEWLWELFPNGELAVHMGCYSYERTLRVWIKGDIINIDVLCGNVPFNAHMLTWILAENFGQVFTARATPPENNLVPIYLTADYRLERIHELAQLIWAGYQASLTWWGRMIRVKMPEEPQAISA